MKRGRGNPNPGLARLGKPLPKLTCVNCGKVKGAKFFPKRGGPAYEDLKVTDPKRYDTQCKLCKKPRPANAGSDYVHKEPGTLKKYKYKRKVKSTKAAAKTKARTRIETRIKSMLYLAKRGCEDCNERDPRKLEYDHKNPKAKVGGISRFISDGYSWSSPKLRAEIRKCRILCASCHRVRTIKQQGYYASTEVKSTLAAIADEHGFEL